jgi:GTP cyclohydrolase I
MMSLMRRQLAMAKYIQLTNLVHNKTGPDKPGAVYVNTDQICWIATPIGAADAYKTVVMMSGTFVNVKETVAEVMQLIDGSPSS